MKRNAFIKTIALGSAAVCLGCMAGCKKEEDGPVNSTPAQAGFELDLSRSEYAALNNVGGSLEHNGIIIAQNATNSYAAVAISCTHAGTSINYNHSQQRFTCPNHGSQFGLDGAVLVGPATRALQKFTATRTGNILKVA